MKTKFKLKVVWTLLMVFIITGTVFAKESTEKIDVLYDNIKIIIDGKEYTPVDGNGNYVEPFAYNGTTYLPVRAIANAFDKDVDWEPQTSTITIGSKNYDWLDQMGYVDYDTTKPENNFYAIQTGTKMTDGIKYDRGIAFYLNDYDGSVENNDGTYECYQNVSYLLNGQYKSFDGTITVIDSNNGRANIKIYGDGKLLYTSAILSGGTKSTNFSIDVSNVKLIKIHTEYVNILRKYASITVGIADGRFAKK